MRGIALESSSFILILHTNDRAYNSEQEIFAKLFVATLRVFARNHSLKEIFSIIFRFVGDI